jgi:hypothetical protein
LSATAEAYRRFRASRDAVGSRRADRRYLVGERVPVSRVQDGRNHEEATVTDFYELLTSGQEPIPTAVVDFDDGERLYLTARPPDFLPMVEDEEDEDELDDEDGDEGPDADE